MRGFFFFSSVVPRSKQATSGHAYKHKQTCFKSEQSFAMHEHVDAKLLRSRFRGFSQHKISKIYTYGALTYSYRGRIYFLAFFFAKHNRNDTFCVGLLLRYDHFKFQVLVQRRTRLSDIKIQNNKNKTKPVIYPWYIELLLAFPTCFAILLL